MSKIKVFTSPTCPHCRTAKNWLNERKIDYTELDVSSNPSARKEMERYRIMGVPAFVINGEVIVGFDPVRIESLLRKKIVKCPVCDASLRVPSDKGKLMVTCRQCGNRFETQ